MNEDELVHFWDNVTFGEDDDIVDEIYRHRKEMVEEYGGIEGLLKHMDEERPRLIAEGWKFVTVEEMAERNRHKVFA
jgi:hypothetical protein